MPKRILSVLLIVLSLQGFGAGEGRAALPPWLGPSTVEGMVTALEEAGLGLEAWEPLVLGLSRWIGLVTRGIGISYFASEEAVVGLLRASPIFRNAVVAVLREQIAAGFTGPQLLARLGGTEMWLRIAANLVPGVTVSTAEIAAVLARVFGLAAVAAAAGTLGYIAGKSYVKQLDMEAKLADSQALDLALDRIASGVATGGVKLLAGLTVDGAFARIRDNLDAGLPPYVGVMEVRPPPDLSGGWQGDIRIKDVQGQSDKSVGEDCSVTSDRFHIEQDRDRISVSFGESRISGLFGPADFFASFAGKTRTLTVVDNATLLDRIAGTTSRIDLKYYSGAGAGGLAGRLEIEIVEAVDGAVITSGGQLIRGSAAEPPPKNPCSTGGGAARKDGLTLLDVREANNFVNPRPGWTWDAGGGTAREDTIDGVAEYGWSIPANIKPEGNAVSFRARVTAVPRDYPFTAMEAHIELGACCEVLPTETIWIGIGVKPGETKQQENTYNFTYDPHSQEVTLDVLVGEKNIIYRYGRKP